MARPQKYRRIAFSPACLLFEPSPARCRELAEVCLSADELEAVLLRDVAGLYHEQAATRLGVSRQTFGRVMAAARTKIASALLEGRVLRLATGGGACVKPKRVVALTDQGC